MLRAASGTGVLPDEKRWLIANGDRLFGSAAIEVRNGWGVARRLLMVQTAPPENMYQTPAIVGYLFEGIPVGSVPSMNEDGSAGFEEFMHRIAQRAGDIVVPSSNDDSVQPAELPDVDPAETSWLISNGDFFMATAPSKNRERWQLHRWLLDPPSDFLTLHSVSPLFEADLRLRDCFHLEKTGDTIRLRYIWSHER